MIWLIQLNPDNSTSVIRVKRYFFRHNNEKNSSNNLTSNNRVTNEDNSVLNNNRVSTSRNTIAINVEEQNAGMDCVEQTGK